jgi:hypothetical protein
MAREREVITKCESIWGARPPARKTAEQKVQEQVSLGEFILDSMKANERVGQVVRCPNCQAAVAITQEGDEEHVVCTFCGLVAIDGAIVVTGIKGA